MTRKLFTIIVALLVLVQLILMTVFFKSSLNGIFPFNPIIEITKIVFIIICLITIEKYKIRRLVVGHIFILTAWLWNFFETLNFINLTSKTLEILRFILYEIPSVFGVAYLIYGILVSLNDNKILVNKLKSLAFYDPLTNLPNRNIISKTCPITPGQQCNKKGSCACLARREIINSSNSSTILFLDLDEFKLINDNFGHANGDVLLRMVSDRLKECFTKDTKIIHLSGDEFLIIIYNLPLNEVISQVTNLLTLMNSPFILDNKNVIMSSSIGIAQYPKDGIDINEVILKADKAMYKAKKEGKNQYYIYNETIEAETSE
jgi:diguanylate cyclase (GGDEF)-like protein